MEDTYALDVFFAGIDLSTDKGKEKAKKAVHEIFERDGGMDETLSYTPEMAERIFLKSLKAEKLGSGNSLSLYQQENGVWKKRVVSH